MRYLIFVFTLTIGLMVGCGDGGKVQNPVIGNSGYVEEAQKELIIKGNVNEDEKATIRGALTKLFQDSKRDGYSNYLEYKNFIVQIRDDCSPSESGVMTLRIRADSYDGSIYDKNPAEGIGEVLAAEQVIFKNNRPTGEYWICRDSLENMRQTSRFGSEHIILFYNDSQKYERTKTHTDASNGHPLISE